jgi:hypothetical protein
MSVSASVRREHIRREGHAETVARCDAQLRAPSGYDVQNFRRTVSDVFEAAAICAAGATTGAVAVGIIAGGVYGLVRFNDWHNQNVYRDNINVALAAGNDVMKIEQNGYGRYYRIVCDGPGKANAQEGPAAAYVRNFTVRGRVAFLRRPEMGFAD